MVNDVDRRFAVNLVYQMIPPGDDLVFVPIGNIHFDGSIFFGNPLVPRGIDDDLFAIRGNDSAAAFVVEHRIIGGDGMNVALITAHGPFADVRKFFAAVLYPRVVARLTHHHSQLEVLDDAASPDQKLIVG